MAGDEMELGIRLAMESQSFQQQITGINREMKVVQANFNEASSALGDFGNEEQKLEAKSASLTQQIQMSQQKVDLLADAHDKAKQKLAENVAINDELRQSLARSTTAYNESTAATGENSAESLRLRTVMDGLNTQYTASNSLILRNATSTDNLNIRLQNTRTAQNRLQNELTATNTSLEAQRNGLNDVGDSAEKNGSKIEGIKKKISELGSTAMLAGIAAIGAAFTASFGIGIKMSDDLTRALNGVQAAAGITDTGMGEMKKTLTEIYNDNFGESFTEIGESMTLVSQQTGLTGDALKRTTENALLLKDTFQLEVQDSLLGANQLMKQFGTDAETSYNLIAQGAQNGLNANGDLIDTINEYTPTFKAQGFSAEEMFNMLGNASKSGVRNIDLAADAIKEFGIRSKDGSTASADGFKAVGLNAGAMTKEFAKGGDTAKVAFDKTVKALLAMKDPVKQNAAGVALFGTQFEDMGIKGITALVNTNGSIKTTTDSLKKINDVKYNTLGEAIEGIKRSFETGVLLPLGEQITPKLNEWAAWTKLHMPEIKNDFSFAMQVVMDNAPLIVGAVGTIIGIFTAYGAVMLATKIAVMATTVVENIHKASIVAKGIVTTIATAAQYGYIVAMESGSVWLGIVAAAQWVWNAAMTANPIGLTIAALALLGIAIYKIVKHWDDVTAAIKKAWDWLTFWNNTPAEDKDSTVTTYHNDVSQNTTADGMRVGRNATGTSNWRGGLTWVGEQGPELIRLPSGSQVKTNKESMEIANNQASNKDGGGLTVTIENFVNNRTQDVQAFAEELEFYRKQVSGGKGGN